MAALVTILAALAAAAASNETPAPAPAVTAPAAAAPPPAPSPPPYYSRPNPFAPPVEPPALPGDAKTEPPSGAAVQAAPSAATPPGAEPPPAPPAVPKLNGILFSPEMPVAIVSDTLVRLGDLVDGYRITAITPEAVTLRKEGTNYRMTPLAPVMRPADLPATPEKVEPEKVEPPTSPGDTQQPQPATLEKSDPPTVSEAREEKQ